MLCLWSGIGRLLLENRLAGADRALRSVLVVGFHGVGSRESHKSCFKGLQAFLSIAGVAGIQFGFRLAWLYAESVSNRRFVKFCLVMTNLGRCWA